MKYPSPGQHRTFEAFRAHLRAVDASLDCAPSPGGAASALARPFELGTRRIGNRFAMQPMEGWDGTHDGLPTEHTLRRWRRFGGSGAKLIWGGEAFAVCGDGRANPNQLFLRDGDPGESERGLVALLGELRDGHRALGESLDDLYVGLQLTHSGRFARPGRDPAPRIAYRHPVLDARVGVTSDRAVLSDGELDAIAERYVAAARTAQRAGFDFVDVKCCHGYLLHELLGARTRPGRYGGALEDRARFVLGIVAAISAECPGLAVAVRASIADVHPHAPDPTTRVGAPDRFDAASAARSLGAAATDPSAFDWDEPLRFLALLRGAGISLVNVTLGSPYYCPHLQRPAAYPPSDGYLPPEDPLLSVARHLAAVRRCRASCPELALVGSGYSYLQEWLPHVAEHEVGNGHVDFVGLGRMALVYPDLAGDVVRGRPIDRKRICRTFSDCTTAPRNGMISGCYPLDPYYRDRPEAARVKELRAR